MRTLIYIPIIHTSADLGSLAKDVTKRGIANLGDELWERHRKTVEGFWDAIAAYSDSIDASGTKIYQDGMVAEGEVGEKIVEEGVRSGSKNFELVSRLIKRGAILVRTEDFKLVKEERDRLVSITQASYISQKILAFIKYRLKKNKLLEKRDRFISRRIDQTLNHREKGIIFIGAYHNIKKKLPKDIEIREIKDTRKVMRYQSLLPFYKRNKEQFEELSRYLISPIS
ncbi:MAG: hypothetical protein KJ706_04630 [Candidatus Omnitrophica bacterium]|nr:hypothetical protein [Candidatus Omnitrophota bacterium]